MAQATTNVTVATPGFLERIGTFFVRLAENNVRARRIEYLQSLSDDQLHRIGLRREDIVRHVFSDVMHT